MEKHQLREVVIERLLSGEKLTSDLVEEISFVEHVTVQGVYKALRELRKEEVTSAHGKSVSLSHTWITEQQEKLLFAEKAHRATPYLEGIRSGKSQRKSFTFTNLNEFDLFWTHAYILLARDIDVAHHSYPIQPHDWYLYARPSGDRYWIKAHKETGRITRATITHSAALDKEVMHVRKKQLGRLQEFMLGVNPLKQPNHIYYNILADYVFTAKFDKAVAEELDAFTRCGYALPLDAKAQEQINSILEKKGKFTLTIVKSKKKSDALVKKVIKYFE